MSKEVCPWVWACHGRMVKPSVHHRPPFPMSARERLYEIRKRYRKTEIWSESWRLDFKANDFCQFCLGLEDGECIADDCFGCPYARERNAYRCRIEAEARFHRPTRRERLYERRKQTAVRYTLMMHVYCRRKHPDGFRAYCNAVYDLRPFAPSPR